MFKKLIWFWEFIKNIIVLDINTYILGHYNGVTTMAISKNERLLASASKDSDIRLWDLQEIALICVFSDYEKKKK